MITDFEGNPSNWIYWTIGIVLLLLGGWFELWPVVFGVLAGYVTRWWVEIISDQDEYRVDLSDDIFITINNASIALGVGLGITFILFLAGLK